MPILSSLPAHLFYLLLLTALGLALPDAAWDPVSDQFIFIIGGLALWRYGWGLTHWLRYQLYHHLTFPRLRRKADAMGEHGQPTHAYLLVTSFRIGAETTRRVYESVIKEAIHYHTTHEVPVTIVVSIVELADQFLIRRLFEHLNPPEGVKLVYVRIGGTGKRDALGSGFRAISLEHPPAGSVVAVIDGDSMLPKGTIQKCASMFAVMPRLGALTTDEICEVEGAWIFREWYNMRFAQRHIMMGSVSLSRRVLTLTGRMSMFRADIVCDPDFIERVERDWLDHWRLGRFKFLTGDDKSSWYHVLSKGYEMIYVEDVKVVTIETPPEPSFVKSSLVLMRRWFGNMLRTNGRALRLGPQTTNLFPWLSILDQRISMWTSLTGLAAAILAAIAYDVLFLLYYGWWMLFTRYVLTLSLLAARQQVSISYPFLLYYNQIIGSLVKTFVLFRLDKQRWTRQNTVLASGGTILADRLRAYGSVYLNMLAYSVFITMLALLTGILSVPDTAFWTFYIAR